MAALGESQGEEGLLNVGESCVARLGGAWHQGPRVRARSYTTLPIRRFCLPALSRLTPHCCTAVPWPSGGDQGAQAEERRIPPLLRLRQGDGAEEVDACPRGPRGPSVPSSLSFSARPSLQGGSQAAGAEARPAALCPPQLLDRPAHRARRRRAVRFQRRGDASGAGGASLPSAAPSRGPGSSRRGAGASGGISPPAAPAARSLAAAVLAHRLLLVRVWVR